MNEDLKLKGSAGLNFLRCIVFIGIILGIVFAFLSLYDPRTDEEKEADARAEFLSDHYVVSALNGVRKVYVKYGISELKSVSYLYGSKEKYVLVTYTDKYGSEEKRCYNLTKDKFCDPDEFYDASAKLGAYNNFVNSKKEYRRDFSEQHELQILLEEVIG